MPRFYSYVNADTYSIYRISILVNDTFVDTFVVLSDALSRASDSWYNWAKCKTKIQMKPLHIVVIGAVAVDVKAKSFGALVRNADVPGRTRVTIGGVARNAAKNLARLGADVAIISAVGDDEFGRLIRGDLSRAGVNVDHLLVARDCRTATWVGILDERGDLAIGVFGGEILGTITPQVIGDRAAMIGDADLIAIDATLPRAAIDAIVARAKANHVPLYLNPASVARAQTVADCVGDSTLVTANSLEAQVFTGQSIGTIEDAKRAARMLIERGVQRAIVTLGADGIVYADARVTRHMPAHPTRVVDTTGAGDALAAMFLLCHLQARSLDETLKRALRVAAITVACEESVSEEVVQLADGLAKDEEANDLTQIKFI